MARSTVVANKKLQKQPSGRQLRNRNTAMAPPVAVAAAAALAASHEDAECSSATKHDAPSRKRSNSSATAAIATRTRAASAGRSSRATQKQKRSTSEGSSSSTITEAPLEKGTAKRRKKSVEPSNVMTAKKKPLIQPPPPPPPDTTATKSQQQQQQQQQQLFHLNQVTPSPASHPASPAFSFNSPNAKTRQRKALAMEPPEGSVPAGVVNLYPSKGSSVPLCAPSSNCTCHSHCDSKSLTSCYIQTYGKEYWQYLKDHEQAIIVESSAQNSPSSTRTLNSQNSRGSSRQSLQQQREPPPAEDAEWMNPDAGSSVASAADSSIWSQQTPANRREWVMIEAPNMMVEKPVESTQFLDYQPELTPKMRAILMDWIIELSEHFSFGPVTLHLAITLIDKVLACGPLSIDDSVDGGDPADVDGAESRTECFLISRDRFQLLGATCTWLACKLEEVKAPEISQIAYVSDNIYTVGQIKRMERRVCKALHFSLIHTSPFSFVHEFIRASCECPNPKCETPLVFQYMVHYLLELGRLPYAPITKKPSLLAAAAVYLARVTLGMGTGPHGEGIWTKTLQYYTGYTKEDLKETVHLIHSYHLAAEDSSLKSVFAKYKNKKYRRVALKTVALKDALGF